MCIPLTLLTKFLYFRMTHNNFRAIFIAFALWWFCVFSSLWSISHPIPIWKNGFSERIYVVCTYVLMYVDVCMYLFTYLRTYVCLYVCTYVFMHVGMYIYAYLRMYIRISVCRDVCVCLYVCMQVYTYVRTYVRMCTCSHVLRYCTV